ncbi:CDC24 [Sanghuangporus weigelae]
MSAAAVAGRKKSVISTAGLQIDTPVAHNTFLNKSAASSTSLYQQCSQLRARLLRIHSFPAYFAVGLSSETRTSVDPVTQLWDCFALGVPLCFLHNLLPNVAPINNVETDPESIDAQNSKAAKKAIVHFAMAIGNNPDLFDTSEQFTATQVLDRSTTDGFVKVVNCVTRLVDRLPDDCFQEAPPVSPPSLLPSHESTDSLINPDSPMHSAPANAQENARNNIIREIVETERKYVQDLEHMQKYANALNATSAIDQDTIHLLFPGLSKLLDFQRRFLIKLEGVAELPWKEQRWGLHFTENENEFSVYEPYCANYSEAMDILLTVESNLMTVNLINAKSELPAFLIKPVQRICKYPLLLESLVKAAANTDYPYFEELEKGLEAAKRIADRINEAQRRSENAQTVASLEARVEDWKGHHLSNFGELILEDIFMVMKMDIDREYHVFLFEKIILCCKEILPTANGGTIRKSSKSNSILKKQPMQTPGGPGLSRKKNTPLLLKGRIFLNNVTHTCRSVTPGPQYSLQVWWRGDDDNEYFTLRCRSEEQLNKWETAINALIERTQARRGSESQRNATIQANSTNPSQLRHLDMARKLSSTSNQSVMSPISGPSSATRRYPPTSFDYDAHRSRDSSVSNGAYFAAAAATAGPSGYPQDVDHGYDDYDEYQYGSHYASSSGRGTPIGTRRGNVAQSMVQEREMNGAYDRPRARTEDQDGATLRQWRKNGQPMPPPPPPPVGALPNPLLRGRPPAPSRMMSDASDMSFGPGVASRPQPTLRSKFSANRLNSHYDSNESDRTVTTLNRAPSRPTMRSRSASQPSSYNPPPPSQPPPLPKSNWAEISKGSVMDSSSSNKRGSGSSESTGESSDYSPHSASPITPYGSSDSSLPGTTLRPSRSQVYLQKPSSIVPQGVGVPLVKVKVYFLDDIFAIQVPRTIEYEELVEKVGKKIRLCGPRRDDGPLKVKYVDEDGDMVSLGSTEDVQMAFDSMQAGNQVTFHVS